MSDKGVENVGENLEKDILSELQRSIEKGTAKVDIVNDLSGMELDRIKDRIKSNVWYHPNSEKADETRNCLIINENTHAGIFLTAYIKEPSYEVFVPAASIDFSRDYMDFIDKQTNNYEKISSDNMNEVLYDSFSGKNYVFYGHDYYLAKDIDKIAELNKDNNILKGKGKVENETEQQPKVKEQETVETKNEEVNIRNRYYFEIDETAAKMAHKMNYYYPYIYGTKTNEYKTEVDEVYSIADKISTIKPMEPEEMESIYSLAKQFSKQLAENMNQAIKVESMCPSEMIAGASNISAEKRAQQSKARFNNREEYRKIESIKERLTNILNGKEKIPVINKHNHEKSDKKEFQKSEEQSQKKDIEKAQQGHQEEKKVEVNNKYFQKIENTEKTMLQLVFAGKPNEKMRDVLKDNYFRWSSEDNAWERRLTDNAKKASENVLNKFKELDEQGEVQFEKTDTQTKTHNGNMKFHGKEFEQRDYDFSKLEEQLRLSRDRKYKEALQGNLETKLENTEDILHQERLGMVEDVAIEIEIGE